MVGPKWKPPMTWRRFSLAYETEEKKMFIEVGHPVDGRNPKQPPFGCIKPCKEWNKLPTSTGAGFLPSTVCLLVSVAASPF